MGLRKSLNLENMEKVNVSIASSSRENLLQLQDQSSKQRRKLAITVSFLILFTLTICSIISVFSVLKHDIESQSLSKNPPKAIRSVCSVTPFPYECFDTIWDLLETPNKISTTINSPSEIFLLSVRVAFFELNDLSSVTHTQITQNSRTQLALSLSLNRCEILFNSSLVLLNNTMDLMNLYSDKNNIFKENRNIIFVLKKWMSEASRNLEKCVNGTGNSTEDDLNLKYRLKYTTKPYMENSLTMILKMEEILDMFDPSLQSILANLLLSSPEYAFTITLFCLQYLVIIVLIFLVLRLYL